MNLRRLFIRRIQHSGYLLPSSLTLYLWLKGVHPALPGFSCPFHSLTGIPCPTCFLTRATSDALHGDLGSSIGHHAFGPLAAIALLFWSVQSIKHRRLFPLRTKALPFIIGSIVFLVYWLLRLGLTFGVGLRGFPAFPSV